MTRWDAARAASQRTTREYKPVAPVGRKHGLEVTRDDGDVPVERCCGYHVCSCARCETCGHKHIPNEQCDVCTCSGHFKFKAQQEALRPYWAAMDEKIKALMKSPVTQVFLEHGILTGDFTAFEPPKEEP